MGPLSEMPQRPPIRWHLPATVFFVVTAIAFASLRIARTAILSDGTLSSGIASLYPAQPLPIDPIEAARQALLESLAVDNQRFDALTQQRNSLSPSSSGETPKILTSSTVLKPGLSLSTVRSQLASALASLISLEKSPYASGSEILSVRNQITRLQKRMADLEGHKPLAKTPPPPATSQPPSQTALLDEQIAQTQLQTITDLQAIARLQKDHPAAQAAQAPSLLPDNLPPNTSALPGTASSRVIQRTAVLLARLHLSASQRAAISSISALYALALSLSLGFILSLFTLLLLEGFRVPPDAPITQRQPE